MRPAIVVVVALVGRQAAAAPAQSEVTADSVDVLTERSVAVVEGTVTKVTPFGPMSIAPRGGFNVTIDVEAVVKGEKGLRTSGGLWRGEAPRVGDRVLAFTAIENRLAAPGPGLVPEAMLIHIAGARGEPWKIATRRFTYVTGRPAVLDAVRTRIDVHHWESWVTTRVPPESPLGREGVTRLRLPIDDDTEADALRMVKSADVETRRAGVQLLREFESGENIRTVLALTTDPGVGPDAIAMLRHWDVPLP